MNFLLRKDEAEKTYRKIDESYTKTETDEMLNGDISKYIVIQNITPIMRDGKEQIIVHVTRPITSPINKTMKLGLLYQTNIINESSSILITDKTTIEDVGTENIKHGTVEFKGSLTGPLVIDVSGNEHHYLALKFYVQFEDSNGDIKTIYGPAYIYHYDSLLSQLNEGVNNTEIIKNLNNNIDTINTELSNKVDKINGKVLSANDFTNELKTKLEGIEGGANKVVIDTELSTLSNNGISNSAVSEKFNSIDSNILELNQDRMLYITDCETTLVNQKTQCITYTIVACVDSEYTITEIGVLYQDTFEDFNCEINRITPEVTIGDVDNTYVKIRKKKYTNSSYTNTSESLKITASVGNNIFNKYNFRPYAKVNHNATNTDFIIYGACYSPNWGNIANNLYNTITFFPQINNALNQTKDTGWKNVVLPTSSIIDTTNSVIKYRIIGNIISFQGKIKILDSATSSSEYSISVTNTNFVPSWLTASDYPYGTFVAGCPDLNGTDDVLARIRVSSTGLTEFLFSSLTHANLATGQTYIFNFTYMR